MAQEITFESVWARLPQRRPESNKGSYGRVLILAGSSCYRGAAALAAEGALRSGAGLVTLAATEPVIWGVTPRLPECCFLPVAAAGEGGISAAEAPRLLEKARTCTALLIGPGLGCTESTKALVEALVSEVSCPVVLDADGLNAAARLESLPHPLENAPLVLTPHPGEMARLSGLSVDEVLASAEGTASSYARAHDCLLVLKTHRTLLASPDGATYKNTTGNASLARGGSGDILAGMIVGLLAQGLPAMDAACCAVWLHGAAADETARRAGQYGMLPHDIFYDLERLFAQNGR